MHTPVPTRHYENFQGVKKRNCLLLGDEVSIKYMSEDQVLRYGKKLELTCRAVGLPTPTIKWSTPNRSVSSKYFT